MFHVVNDRQMKVKIKEDGVFFERLEMDPKQLRNLDEQQLIVESKKETESFDESKVVDYLDDEMTE